MSEHDAINQPREVVQAGGEAVAVAPLTLAQVPAFARAVRPMMATLLQLVREQQTEGKIDVDIVGLLDDHGEALIRAIAVATGKSEQWVGGLGLDETVRLVEKVVEVNFDFFIHRLLPTMMQTQATLNRRLRTQAPDGPTPSSGSSPAATDATRSSATA